MAARSTRSTATTFQIAERAVIALYDGGVLSPAVLERVLSAFVGTDIDWDADAKARSVDGRGLAEIVAMTMMPGRTSRTAVKDFASIVEHFESGQVHATGARASTRDEDGDDGIEQDASEDDEQLLDQLGDRARSAKRARATRSTSSGSTAGFNPFVNARPPGGKK